MGDESTAESDGPGPAMDLNAPDLPDPFALFDEWASPEDNEAYAQL